MGNKRANDLNGSEWTKYSISVWNDIHKTPEENRIKHPAMFPEMLVNRLIRCFTTDEEKCILDPFMGSGSTIFTANNLGKQGIGFDLNKEYTKLAQDRLAQLSLFNNVEPKIFNMDARDMLKVIPADSVDSKRQIVPTLSQGGDWSKLFIDPT